MSHAEKESSTVKKKPFVCVMLFITSRTVFHIRPPDVRIHVPTWSICVSPFNTVTNALWLTPQASLSHFEMHSPHEGLSHCSITQAINLTPGERVHELGRLKNSAESSVLHNLLSEGKCRAPVRHPCFSGCLFGLLSGILSGFYAAFSVFQKVTAIC